MPALRKGDVRQTRRSAAAVSVAVNSFCTIYLLRIVSYYLRSAEDFLSARVFILRYSGPFWSTSQGAAVSYTVDSVPP